MHHIIKKKSLLKSFSFSGTLILVMVLSMIMSVSCLKPPSGDNTLQSVLPVLSDSIPFLSLGKGKLVFERVGPVVNAYNGIYVVDLDQKKKWGIGSEVIVDPAVSPDGKSIAYVAWNSDTALYDVCVMKIDGSNRIDISNMAGHETCPSWTYDGSQVLYSRNYYYSDAKIIEATYRQSPVTNPNDRSMIIDYNAIDPPNIIPGRVLVSCSATGKLLLSAEGIRTFNSDGSGMRVIIPYDEYSDHLLFSPAWSPDGTKIVYLSYKENTDIKVIVTDANGANADTLVTLPVTGNRYWNSVNNKISLCWSPDGNQIAFNRPDGFPNGGVGSHIWVINKDHTGLTQVTYIDGVSDVSLSWCN